MSIGLQCAWLFLLAIPVACISWTVTHEEIFREPRDYCVKRSKYDHNLLTRKFFYLFTCEYCFSHYIAIGFLFLTEFRMLFPDWRGYLVSGFSLVWIANVYMSLFSMIRMDIKKEKTIIKEIEKAVEEKSTDPGIGQQQG